MAMNKRGGEWCVLRTSGPNTIGLFRSLAAAGFEVWTPIENQSRRKPRNKAKVECEVPIMPTYIFARADQLVDLIDLSFAPLKNHRDFSVFRYFARYPLISDDSLGSLRLIERKLAVRKNKDAGFTAGERVRLNEGGFAGMSGVVETSKGQFTLVCFPGFNIPVKIASWHLVKDQVQEPDIAAQAA
jgi:transcription antitermination factor NusG